MGSNSSSPGAATPPTPPKDKSEEKKHSFKAKAAYNTLLLGTSSVGKTAVYKRIVGGDEWAFQAELAPTVGLAGGAVVGAEESAAKVEAGSANATATAESDVKVELEGSEPVSIRIMDCGGQQRFEKIAETFLKTMDAAIILYSVEDSASLDKVEAWLEQIDQLRKGTGDSPPKRIEVVLVCNKMDLEIPEDELEEGETKGPGEPNFQAYEDRGKAIVRKYSDREYHGVKFPIRYLQVSAHHDRPGTYENCRDIVNCVAAMINRHVGGAEDAAEKYGWGASGDGDEEWPPVSRYSAADE